MLAQKNIITCRQTHSDRVVVVGKGIKTSAGDALITAEKNVVVGVFTADCLPLLICDPVKNVVAAIHVGHQGLRLGIVQKTLRSLRRQFLSLPDELFCVLGPGICVDHFEVDRDFAKAYARDVGEVLVLQEKSGSKPHIDLKKTVKNILNADGILEKNSDDVGLCTFCDADSFHSYRRDRTAARQINFIGLC